MANALVPESDAIQITAQARDALQRGLQLHVQVSPTAAPTRWPWLALALRGVGLLMCMLNWRFKQSVWRSAVVQKLMVALMLTGGALPAAAHPEPVTLALLDVAPDKVTMDLHVPLSELALAWRKDVDVHPATQFAQWQPQFQAYLLEHLRPVTQGQPWTVSVQEMHVEKTPQATGGELSELVAHLLLVPPAGANTRRFTLHYDLIMHQVVTHKVLVSIRHDWERGQVAEEEAGVIQVNHATGQVEPLEINLASGSWLSGLGGMVRLGMQHIKEGTDHLLFLLVLLLPAALLVNGRQWGSFGGSRYSLVRLLQIVTAFTLGHSVTLLIGALGWLHLPQQPVEVLIAFSILVSAVHAIRPLFPGKEIYVAAVFGLVHGLAFATVLSDLHLAASAMALSILGFNLGIELMQLFVIAVTMPWLILLSLTPLYRMTRLVTAVLSALAALGWMASRISGKTNFVDTAMPTATEYAPLAILLLMLLALPAYLYYGKSARYEQISPAQE